MTIKGSIHRLQMVNKENIHQLTINQEKEENKLNHPFQDQHRKNPLRLFPDQNKRNPLLP